jgi:Kef-type K+ transport system membrane component KefB
MKEGYLCQVLLLLGAAVIYYRWGKTNPHVLILGLFLGCTLFWPPWAWAAADGNDHALLYSISISILVATVLGYLATMIKQPLILAYIAAGIVVGPQVGFGWVQSEHDINKIAEIGLILLLFMIGLEMDLKKLRKAGKSIIVTGVLQFVLCTALGLGFFYLLGFTISSYTGHEYKILGFTIIGGQYDLLYLAISIAISSTTIVVKLLYEKFELDTLAGRIAIGVLIVEDIWAIVIIGLQPNLADPQALKIIISLAKCVFLVIVSMLLSKYVLAYLFKQIAKLPEIVLLTALGWCFFIAGLASYLDLSMEMGALIAGVAISTFPYNVDIISKIISIRDFFLTLFFVALGMLIPNPLDNLGLVVIAAISGAFLVCSRYMVTFPSLYALKNGHRVSLLATINLSQASEFALVIAAIGMKPEYNHIGKDIQNIIILMFVLTSIAATYQIKYSHNLQSFLSRVLTRLGLKDLDTPPVDEASKDHKEIAILGFFRVGSAFVEEIEKLSQEIKDKIVVVDFNPQVYKSLQDKGIKVFYGDISNTETLHHAGIEGAKIVLSTIPDEILVGTDNAKIISQMKHLCPEARIIVTAENPSKALKLYDAGADYVFLPNQLAANHLVPIIERFLRGLPGMLREEHIDHLKERREVLD